ncbi:MAG: Asp-tRNA(Asn)/Glu-tRNA(Gln) amidotransferase subunit GatB [Candidatus Azambacteria bacterium]|nr:Asp-tRNA(Asn)/Glu-tRNA(Gln) amidotransferase subunit GatB [Candidatus Azambacteria bacterium]
MVKDKKVEYEPVIGLEIHAELKTKTKMFCACKNDPDERHPNVNICPICTGQPGTLPVINREAVAHVIKTGLALKSKIPEITKWDRKNYFYPDLPKGYQISQYDKPICLGGELDKIKITRVHLEEDTGRLVHFGHIGHSLVDFNRAGVPLMELVTEPDFTSGEEASAFAQELQLILRYLGVSDADMEKGQMRVEANLSLKPIGAKELGTKVEVKNLNSFKAVRDAIDFEIKRQTKILERDEKIVQQTYGWNESKGETVLQRTKEESHDYRYFPEPDLPPMITNTELVKEIEAGLPELPSGKRKRFKSEYGLADNQINILVNNKKLAGFFENVASELQELEEGDRKKIVVLSANYILGDFLGLLNEASAEVDDTRITAEDFAELIGLVHRGAITTSTAKEVLKEMWATGKDPSNIIDEKNLGQVQDVGELEKAASKIISENQTAAADYKKGKEASLQFLIGQVMRETRGKANPETISGILKKLLR